MKRAAVDVVNLSMCKDPYDLFQLHHNFNVDLKDLDHRYRTLLQVCHPDRALNGVDKELYAQKATAITDAYEVLKSPFKRAVFLLKQQGFDALHGQPDPSFLMEMMSLQEDMMEGKNHSHDLQTRQHHLLHLISQAFEQKKYEEAKGYLQQYHFITKLGSTSHAIATS